MTSMTTMPIMTIPVMTQGFRVVMAKDCWNKSLGPLMAEVRGMMGDGPVYISFDIDALDPSFAPGTGELMLARLAAGM